MYGEIYFRYANLTYEYQTTTYIIYFYSNRPCNAYITFEIIVVKTMHNALYIKPNQLNKIKVSILWTGNTIRYEFL